MKADLHFHPSFFSKGDKGRILEPQWARPTLAKLEEKALEKGIDILAVTSCSHDRNTDRRWEAYMKEAEENKDGSMTILGPQGIRCQALGDKVSQPIYIIHGQQIKTDKAELNVLFADEQIYVEGTGAKFNDVLKMARDSGENVLVGLSSPYKAEMAPSDMRTLYRAEQIDFLEAYDSMARIGCNAYAEKLSEKTGIPGIAISNGHRLADMGSALIKNDEPQYLKTMSYQQLAKFTGNMIANKDFGRERFPVSTTSKGIFLARLINCELSNKLGIK